MRSIGLTWGLPNASRWYSYHPDESARQIVGAVVSLLQGDFNPHFFNYPSLSVYATWLFYQLLAGFGLTTGTSPETYPWPVVRDIILAGRIFSVLSGALTAPLVFLIARRLKAGNWAILAGVLAALAPGHVQHSHFATVDVPATFLVVLCLYITIRAQNFKTLLWAAFVAGLAASTKYNAGLVLIAPLVAFFGLENRKPIFAIPAFLGMALLAFGLATPFAFLSPTEFWGDGLRGGESGFAYELLVHPKIGSGEIFQATGNGWLYHLTFNLPFLLTWPLIVAALIGIVGAAKKRNWWPMLIFGALFFGSLGFSQVRFMRYLLPLAPVLCLLAAYGAAQLPKPKLWGAMLAIFALWGTKDVLWPFTQTDPRDQIAGKYPDFRANAYALAHNPWFYTPPFQPQGFNLPVAGIPVVGWDKAKLDAADSWFAASEFEWRETVRLQPQGEVARFLQSLGKFESAKVRVPLALPGRDFVPQDYLYTNPETRLYFPSGG